MALKAILETRFGEERELYVRVNNVEANNHGAACYALFRGFLSKEAFDARKAFLWEYEVTFQPDVSKPLWEQAYEALKAIDPVAPVHAELEAIDGDVPPEMKDRFAAAEKLYAAIAAAVDC